MDDRAFDVELEELRRRSVDRLLAADFFDPDAFGKLFDYLEEKAERIAGEYVVSKQVLACLRDAQSAIESRSEYLPQVREHVGEVRKFAMLLDLIILGEKPSDRRLVEPRAF